MNKIKTLIYLLLVVLSVTVVYAGSGMGIICDMDYGIVNNNNNYIKDFKFDPYDQNYFPYTDVIPNITAFVVIETTAPIEVNSSYPYLDFQQNWSVPINQYTYVPITLVVPKNAKKGVYSYKICATWITGAYFNYGSCTDITYEVVRIKNKDMKLKMR